jgi:ubiquinone/menaquinone biosynthesis C-methylase UbiE
MGPAPVLLHCLSGRFQGELLGTDIDPRSVMMSSRMWKSSFDHLPVEFLVCAGEFLPFRDETSDLILSVNSLHHWNHPIKIFTEVKRILKPGGGAVIVDYRRDLRKEQLRALEASYRNPILRYRLRRSIEESYLPSEVNRLLKRSGFTRREVTAVPNGLKAGGTK